MTTVLNNQLHESIKKQVVAEYQEHLKSLENNSIGYSPDNEDNFFNQSLELVVFTELKTILTNTNALDYVDKFSLTSLLELNICESFWWLWIGYTELDRKDKVCILKETHWRNLSCQRAERDAVTQMNLNIKS